MSTEVSQIILIHFILISILFLIYGIVFKEFLKVVSIKSKLLFGIVAGLIGSIMFLVEDYSNLDCEYCIIVYSIRILLFTLVILNSGMIASITASIIIMTTRSILYEFLWSELFVLVGLIIIVNFLHHHVKITETFKWVISVITVSAILFYHIIFVDLPLNVYVAYILSMIVLQLIIYYLFLNLNKTNQKFNEFSKNKKMNYVSDVYEYQVIEEKVNDFIQKDIPFQLVLLSIDNYKNFCTKIKFTILKNFAKKVGEDIKVNISHNGEVGKIGNDQYFILFSENLDLIPDIMNNICENIMIDFKKYVNLNNLVSDIKLSVKYLNEDMQEEHLNGRRGVCEWIY